MMNDVYTVEQINQGFKDMIKNNTILNNINITGEISNFKISGNNLYFTIKDNISSLNAVCWNFTNRFDINITNGEKIILEGYINISKNNTIQIIVNGFQQINDIGDIYKEYIKLKEHFEKIGYFDNNHKKILPKYIKNIGIATALDGAALQDILYVLKKGFKGNVCIKGCIVQGNNCELSVKGAIEFLDNRNLDVIIVTRGGGSYEDLYGFSKKKVIKAIYKAKTCIISAVGHEVDSMLSDFVADIRAPTPSIAAEIIVSNQKSNYGINIYKNYINELYFKIKSIISIMGDKLKVLENRIHNNNPKIIIQNKLSIYINYLEKIKFYMSNKLKVYHNLFNKYEILKNNMENNLKSNNKSDIMKKGYMQLYNGTINISSIEQLCKLQKKYSNGNKKLKLKFIDGTAEICIQNININDNKHK